MLTRQHVCRDGGKLGKEVGRVADSMGGADKLLIMSDSYQEASELAFLYSGAAEDLLHS